MKRRLLYGFLILFKVLIINAQWTGTNPITTTSNVGIGESNPDQKLNISQTENVSAADIKRYPLKLSLIDNAGGLWQGSGVGLKFHLTASDVNFDAAEILGVAKTTGTSNGDLIFNTAKNGIMSTKLTINPDGNVGFGTTTPSLAKLQVKTTIGSSSDVLAFYTEDGTNNPRVIISHVTATNDQYLKFDSSFGSGSGYADFIFMNGSVGIGLTNPGTYKLNVAGKIRATEIVVNTTGADYVFSNNYKLPPLSQVEAFIKENKHLPEIDPADQMKKNGVDVSELQTKLLQKVEELTLYLIDLNKEVEKLKKENERLKKEGIQK